MTGEFEERVSESVEEVTAAVNIGRKEGHGFVNLTDADSGKGITVDPNRVFDIHEE